MVEWNSTLTKRSFYKLFVVGLCEHRFGLRAVNDCIQKYFVTFTPKEQHFNLLALPWDAIYTTNYDVLIETAARSAPLKYHESTKAIFSNATPLERLTEQDLPYYKLHGCINHANTDEGRLILTKWDYRFYETHRKTLFKRLEQDLVSRTFVFVGYSLNDPNFRAILNDISEQLDLTSLPTSFAIRPGASDVEKEFWKSKYNITLLSWTSVEFLHLLRECWESENRFILTPRQRLEKRLAKADSLTSFSVIGDSFYKIELGQITGHPNALVFFTGAPPTWADIKGKIPALRDQYWPIMEAIYAELTEVSARPSAYLITGAAGTGKTTLIKSILYDVLSEFDAGQIVLEHIPGTPLDVKALSVLSASNKDKRILM